MILKAFTEKNQKYKTRSGLEIDRFETYIKVSLAIKSRNSLVMGIAKN